MRDNRNFILVKEYGFRFKTMDEDLEILTKSSARCGIKGSGSFTRIEIYCRIRGSEVYNLATKLGFREEIGG